MPFITFCVKPVKKAWINLAGCNFNCKGCFAVAKDDVGKPFSVDELVRFFISACRYVCGELVDDVTITGGEPTLNPAYLTSLIQRLRDHSVTKIALSTNGYLLDEDFVRRLRTLELDLVKIDIKAFSEDIHYWYTGESNKNVFKTVKLLHDYNVNFYVRTILMPGIVDVYEVEKIAKFLFSINPSIHYRIYEFDPKHAREPVSSKPSRNTMVQALNAAKRYLVNVTSITASETYDSSYEYVEVRDDSLLEVFNKVDEVSKMSIKGWKMVGIPFSKIVSG